MAKAQHSLNSFKSERQLTVGTKTYTYYSLPDAEKNGLHGISKLPNSLKVLLENLLRFEDGVTVTKQAIENTAKWLVSRASDQEIAYRPARVLMQDFTGVPAVVDLAAMRDATQKLGKNPKKINPLVPVDLVIDHSVMVDFFASEGAFEKNTALEYQRNIERYQFLKWGQKAFDNFRVVPPGTGICHQVNLENLAQTVWTKRVRYGNSSVEYAFPDTLVGTDSHTTMVNGLSVLGWGVGGIEAEAAMLGQPISMLVPEVIGFEITGSLSEGITATDLVLTVTQMLRKKGVVGKFVEFYGAGLDHLSLEDRATISNMAPEYGATCGFFPTDDETLRYLKATGRKKARIELVEAYAKAQGLWRGQHDALYTDTLHLDMGEVEASLAGPKRPQDRIALRDAAKGFADSFKTEYKRQKKDIKDRFPVKGRGHDLGHGDVVIAAITSCTNTSNPSVMIAAGLLARNAVKKGLNVKPWVKTSLAPGSQVVTDYLEKAELDGDLDALGFNLVGYGCTTCIGNSGPLPQEISDSIQANDIVAASVLSGNRNFEGRVNQDVRANYLASPPLVVAYALAGSMNHDFQKHPLGVGSNGKNVYLRHIWPSQKQIQAAVRKSIKTSMFVDRYKNAFDGDAAWQKIQVSESMTYDWDDSSTYVQNPPYFEDLSKKQGTIRDIVGARVLGLFGDSITTDHISPAGSIKKASPAGAYLMQHGVEQADFNSYGSRRGNHEVMMRGTFANIRIKNQMVAGVEGGVTVHHPSGRQMSIYDAAMAYKDDSVPLVVLAGKEYGTGSSRDWAAKGTKLLGVRAVIAESFERIHRSNLVGMGVLPLTFKEGQSWQSLKLTGEESFTLTGLNVITPRCDIVATLTRSNGKTEEVTLLCRVDTEDELNYMKDGGILSYVLKNLAA